MELYIGFGSLGFIVARLVFAIATEVNKTNKEETK